MNILMICPEGDGFSLALALQRDGHDVKVHCKDKKFKHSMEGILNKVPSYRPHLKKADLVLVDMVGAGNLQKELDRSKIPYIGANLTADAMELDRGKQMDLFKRVGIQLPPTYHFANPIGASKLAKMWTAPGYVVKPSGNLNTASTRVCTTVEEYEWALEQFSADQELVVQKIVKGVEVSTEGWFDGTDWVHFNHTFEEKRLFPGKLGQNTGCMGNVVIEGAMGSLLCKELQKLTPFLTRAKYRGPIDINTIVNEDGPHTLEVTARFGYDAIEALWAMSTGMAEFLLSVAQGQGNPLDLKQPAGAAIRLSLPPYPMAEPDEEDRGRPIVVTGDSRDILWSDTYQQGDKMFSAGADGVIAKAVGSASNPQEAVKAAYKVAKQVSAPDLQYRIDIGERVKADLAKLDELGVI